jgi:DNA-binding PadR family transcriptional regulator
VGLSPAVLGDFEQLVLLAVLRLDANAYGASVFDELRRQTRRRSARGAVYMTLNRLERKGLLVSTLSEPTPERGGRARRCYRLTRPAKLALAASRHALLNLWQGLEVQLE